MTTPSTRIALSGLDPIPIHLTIAGTFSQEALLAAACLPATSFMTTVRPFQLQQHDATTYELVLGPAGFGAVLLEALQWLARATAAGMVAAVDSEQVLAFVQQYLEIERPDWRFEELTEHAATFIHHRYQLAAYREELENTPPDPLLSALIVSIQHWHAKQS